MFLDVPNPLLLWCCYFNSQSQLLRIARLISFLFASRTYSTANLLNCPRLISLSQKLGGRLFQATWAAEWKLRLQHVSLHGFFNPNKVCMTVMWCDLLIRKRHASDESRLFLVGTTTVTSILTMTSEVQQQQPAPIEVEKHNCSDEYTSILGIKFLTKS